MKEIIIKQHVNSPPNTYADRSVPIDGIFATEGINPVFSGYGAFSDGIYSDHRLLWVDIDETLLLGTKATPLWAPKARRLQCNNPMLVTTFNQLQVKHYNKYKLEEKMIQIGAKLQEKVPENEWTTLLEELYQLRVEGILQAEKMPKNTNGTGPLVTTTTGKYDQNMLLPKVPTQVLLMERCK
jgi:hypothetical protein